MGKECNRDRINMLLRCVYLQASPSDTLAQACSRASMCIGCVVGVQFKQREKNGAPISSPDSS